MEGQPAEAPLKVCPHCSVASRTDADVCPSCGRPYGRRGLRLQRPSRWRWWYAIPIVAAAFALGYFGLSQLVDGDESETEAAGITAEQAAAVPDGIARSELAGRLDGESPALAQPKRGEKNVTCEYYGITNQPRGVWEFCFDNDKLVGSASLGAAAPVSSEGLPEGENDESGRKERRGDRAGRASEPGGPSGQQAEHSSGKRVQSIQDPPGGGVDRDRRSQSQLPPEAAQLLLGDGKGDDQSPSKLPPELRELLKGADGSK